jgi:hypothetical protein
VVFSKKPKADFFGAVLCSDIYFYTSFSLTIDKSIKFLSIFKAGEQCQEIEERRWKMSVRVIIERNENEMKLLLKLAPLNMTNWV